MEVTFDVKDRLNNEDDPYQLAYSVEWTKTKAVGFWQMCI